MNVSDHKAAMTTASLAESVGVIFCIAGVVIGVHFGTVGGLFILLAWSLPVLGIGLLLVVAGRILRVVSGGSRSSEG